MAWWSVLGDVFKGTKGVAEVFVENKENRGQRRHDAVMADVSRDLASLEQFTAEFHARANRTKWDSFVDGLNRLPRPLLTISILSFFVLAPLQPERFLLIAKSYELMPAGYWALLSVIVGFYFSGRMQLKAQDMVIRKNAVEAAKELVAMRKTFRQLEVEEETVESKLYDAAMLKQPEPLKNKVVERWLAEQAQG